MRYHPGRCSAIGERGVDCGCATPGELGGKQYAVAVSCNSAIKTGAAFLASCRTGDRCFALTQPIKKRESLIRMARVNRCKRCRIVAIYQTYVRALRHRALNPHEQSADSFLGELEVLPFKRSDLQAAQTAIE